MKFYLASYFLPTPTELEKLIGKPLSKVKGALIPNAGDYYAERARNFKIKSRLDKFSELGLNFDVVDLQTFSDKNTLKQTLKNYELLWVSGGNTFNLRYEMQRSGFDQIITELIQNGLVWAGDSAGACIAGPTLSGIELSDEPEFAEKTIMDGLGLIPHYIVPHCDNPNFATELPAIRELHSKDPNYVELKDNEALIIDGDFSKIVSRPYTPEEAKLKVKL